MRRPPFRKPKKSTTISTSTILLIVLLLFIAWRGGCLSTSEPQKPPPTPPPVTAPAGEQPFLQGWVPDEDGTKRFLKELGDRAQLLQAGPGLIVRDQEPVYLYRALYRAWEHYHPGTKWVVGRQGIGDCFVEGTMVAMADGTEKPIEDMAVGDLVLSHSGVARRVVDTFVKKYTGNLVTIKAKGWDVPVTTTEDHLFVHYPGIVYGSNSRHSQAKPDVTPKWSPVGELSVGDRILLTRPRMNGDFQDLPLRDGRSIQVDDRLGYMLGLYLAEGGLTKYRNGLANRVDFSLGRHEADLISRVQLLSLKVLNHNADVNLLPSKPSVAMVRINDVTIAQAIQHLIPGNVYSKEVPAIVFASPLSVRLALLRGWMDGDGYVKLAAAKGGHSFRVQGVSSSIPLLRSMHRLALSCGLKPSLRMRKPRPDRAPSGDLFLYGESALAVYPERRSDVEQAMSVRGLRQVDRSIVKDGIASPITDISKEAVTDYDVYCISVEDEHSFVANGYGVHNCVSWGFAHGADIHLAVMFSLGDTSEWRPAATEAIYGGSRVEARGRTNGGWVDGSYGGAAAKWLRDWGAVFRQPYNHPRGLIDLSHYDSGRAKNWGNFGCGGQADNGWLDAEAKRFPIKDVALVSDFLEAAAAIQSGYPVAVCSGQGFARTRDNQGFARPAGSWAHCMCLIAVRFDRPGLLCLNSWGPNWISGPKDPPDQPDGSFWIDAKTCTSMLSRKDSFAISGYQGFPYRELKHDEWVLNRRYVDGQPLLATVGGGP